MFHNPFPFTISFPVPFPFPLPRLCSFPIPGPCLTVLRVIHTLAIVKLIAIPKMAPSNTRRCGIHPVLIIIIRVDYLIQN